MKKTVIVIAAAGLIVAFGIVPAEAVERRTTTRSGSVAAAARLDEKTLDTYRVRTEEMTAVRDYYRAHPAPAPEPPAVKKKKKLPPGLRKKVARGGALPPGWQKKVARGEVMDPAVYEHCRPLPPELVRSLPPQPQGTVLVTVEGKAVRLMEATLTILDVFDLL
jgi:hypothetical protein